MGKRVAEIVKKMGITPEELLKPQFPISELRDNGIYSIISGTYVDDLDSLNKELSSIISSPDFSAFTKQTQSSISGSQILLDEIKSSFAENNKQIIRLVKVTDISTWIAIVGVVIGIGGLLIAIFK